MADNNNTATFVEEEYDPDVDGDEIPQPAAPTQPAQTHVAEDGTTYYWNPTNNMWLPQVDEELIKQQQAAYGVAPAAGDAPTKKRKYNKKPKVGEAPQVVENEKDLYVEGLPTDITMEEFVEYFSKVGIIRKDPETGVIKAKIYKTPEGVVKGDGLICYFKKESVDLAIQILDGTNIKGGHQVKLSVAKFVNKPEAKKKKKKTNKKKTKPVVDQKQDLGWGEKESFHVVITNLFHPDESLEDMDFFKDLKEDLTKECDKFGPVDKVTIFEHNPEGVVVVKYKESAGADKCLQVMDGRFFAGRKLHAEFYDGIANYFVEESEEHKKARLDKWNSWLDGDEEKPAV